MVKTSLMLDILVAFRIQDIFGQLSFKFGVILSFKRRCTMLYGAGPFETQYYSMTFVTVCLYIFFNVKSCMVKEAAIGVWG
jgi:hypothetical protein